MEMFDFPAVLRFRINNPFFKTNRSPLPSNKGLKLNGGRSCSSRWWLLTVTERVTRQQMNDYIMTEKVPIERKYHHQHLDALRSSCIVDAASFLTALSTLRGVFRVFSTQHSCSVKNDTFIGGLELRPFILFPF